MVDRRQHISGNSTHESTEDFMHRLPMPPDARDDELKLLRKQVALLELEAKQLCSCLSLLIVKR